MSKTEKEAVGVFQKSVQCVASTLQTWLLLYFLLRHIRIPYTIKYICKHKQHNKKNMWTVNKIWNWTDI